MRTYDITVDHLVPLPMLGVVLGAEVKIRLWYDEKAFHVGDIVTDMSGCDTMLLFEYSIDNDYLIVLDGDKKVKLLKNHVKKITYISVQDLERVCHR